MLILLDDTVLERVTDNKLNEQEWAALSNLAIASIEGKHLVLCSRLLSSTLSKCSQLGNREQGFYRLIQHKYTTWASAISLVKNLIKVVHSGGESSSNNQCGAETILPLEFFSDSTATQRTLLLCEHLNDCSVIEEIYNAYIVKHSLNTCRPSFKKTLGGGDCSADVLEEELKTNRLLFCIMDSDQKSPNSSLGTSALKVKRVFDRERPSHGGLFILKARSLENYLPDSFYNYKYASDVNKQGSIRFLNELEDSSCSNVKFYLHFKNGLSWSQLLNKLLPQDHDSFYKELVNMITEKKITHNIPKNCIESVKCNTKLSECSCKKECVIFAGFGSSVLNDVGDYFTKDAASNYVELEDQYRKLFDELMDQVFSWGFSMGIQHV